MEFTMGWGADYADVWKIIASCARFMTWELIGWAMGDAQEPAAVHALKSAISGLGFELVSVLVEFVFNNSLHSKVGVGVCMAASGLG
ncbi:hypothetical protein [Azonexus sp. IMCC34839]|uniref:hypothetical protein n=1 Tax=Azonexus sp. IMCC34839 TaxID=3133695 RepID=UPI00399BEEF5